MKLIKHVLMVTWILFVKFTQRGFIIMLTKLYTLQ